MKPWWSVSVSSFGSRHRPCASRSLSTIAMRLGSAPAACCSRFRCSRSEAPGSCLAASRARTRWSSQFVPRHDNLFGPRGAAMASANGPLVVADTGHHRLLIWRDAPHDDFTPADFVVGQRDLDERGPQRQASASAPQRSTCRRASRLAPACSRLPMRGTTACCCGTACPRLRTGRPTSCSGKPISRAASPIAAGRARRRHAQLVLRRRHLRRASRCGGHRQPPCAGVELPAARRTARRPISCSARATSRRAMTAAVVRSAQAACAGRTPPRCWPAGCSSPMPERAGSWSGMACPARTARHAMWCLGQSDFDGIDHNRGAYDPSAASLNMPYGIAALRRLLIVADTANSRLLGFRSHRRSRPGHRADRIAGQRTFREKGENRWERAGPRRPVLALRSFDLRRRTVIIADTGNNRVLLWEAHDPRIARRAAPRNPRARPRPRRGISPDRLAPRARAWSCGRGAKRCGRRADPRRRRGARDRAPHCPIASRGAAARPDRWHRQAPSCVAISRRAFASSRAAGGVTRTEIAPDAALCAACAAEILDPYQRRFRYAFATCTHCGPRLSIATAIPYDRADDDDGRFRAMRRTAAPNTRTRPTGGSTPKPPPAMSAGRSRSSCVATGAPSPSRAIRCSTIAMQSCTLLQRGHIVAIKGIGGYQLACDATNGDAVARLRQRQAAREQAVGADGARSRHHPALLRAKRRGRAPAARAPAGPIVLLRADGRTLCRRRWRRASARSASCCRPRRCISSLLRRMDRPVVMTSGNLTDEPQIIDDGEALAPARRHRRIRACPRPSDRHPARRFRWCG